MSSVIADEKLSKTSSYLLTENWPPGILRLSSDKDLKRECPVCNAGIRTS